MEFLKDLGLDKYLLVAQIINFLILFLILKALFFKPLKKVLEERKERIAKGLEDADTARILLEKTQKEKDEIIIAARQEIHLMMENTRKAAEDIKRKIVEDSKQESEKIVSEAKKEAENEMKKMEKQIKIMSLDISKKILSNVIPVLFDEKEKNAVLNKAVKKLEDKNIYEQGKS